MLLALCLLAIEPTRREFVPANRTLVLLRDLALWLRLLLWLLVQLRRSRGCRERGWWERGLDVGEGAVAGGGGGGSAGVLGLRVRMVAVMVVVVMVVAGRLGDVVGEWAGRGVAVGGVRVGG